MNPVTYGDLLDSADRHLIAAGRSRTDLNDRADALRGLYRLTVVMARHLEAVAGPGGVTQAVHSPWQCAAEVGEALHLAADGIAEAVLQTEGTSFPAAEPEKQATRQPAKMSPHGLKHLADAAAAMSAAYDLLLTHQATNPDGIIADRSDWAQIIRSQAVTLAMIREMTEKSGQIASRLTRLMAGTAPLPQAAQAGLLSANDWLRIASQIAASKRGQAADLATGRELLRGIPIATAPDRIAPRVGESTTDLSAGIAATAQRMRSVAFTMLQAAHTSPYISGPAWRWTALSAAIVSDTCTATLHTLADRAADLAAPSVPPVKLREAAKAFGPACAAWRQAASMWQVITTDTQIAVTRATVEADDLVLRMGRLAFANPAWTPAVKQRASRKPPHLLAPDHASLVTVLDAVHRAADAIARMAQADLAAVGIVGDAGRLYMPNTVLWDEHAQARNYAGAPPDRVMLLRDVYQVVVNASKRAAEALDGLALNTGAPSKVLALARQVTATGTPDDNLDLAALVPRLKDFTRPKHTRTHKSDKPLHDDLPDPPEKAPAPVGKSASTEELQIRRGPFESRVRALASTDPGLLLRAAAIDKAGHDLIDQVLSHAKAEDLTPNAAWLAAQDVPAPRSRRPAEPQQGQSRSTQPESSQIPRRAAAR